MATNFDPSIYNIQQMLNDISKQYVPDESEDIPNDLKIPEVDNTDEKELQTNHTQPQEVINDDYSKEKNQILNKIMRDRK